MRFFIYYNVSAKYSRRRGIDVREPTKRIFMYGIIFLVAASLIVIIAALSESRIRMVSSQYEDDLLESHTVNYTIQQEITNLREENELLKKELTEIKASASSSSRYKEEIAALGEALTSISAGDYDRAREILTDMDRNSLLPEMIPFFDMALSRLPAVE